MALPMNKCSCQSRVQITSHPHHLDDGNGGIYSNILHAVGNTPMVRLNKIPLEYGLKCELVAKCEFLNPGGSVKDRVGIRMIEEAEKDGRLKPGATIIEPTSGNTGIALALVCAVKGYRCIILLPEKMSLDKQLTLKALGAEIIRTPDVHYTHPDSHHNLAQRMAKEIPNSLVLNQFDNLANCTAHYETTAEEILEQCDNQVDMVVIGAGTGGTITGIGRKLKEKCPNIKVIGVEPSGSALPFEKDSSRKVGPYDVEGIGLEFVPGNLDCSVVDEWIMVDDKDTFLMARKIIKEEGLLCGGSSGAVVSAAVKAAQDLKEGQRCVVVFPDGIRNYMTKFIIDPWMIERDFMNIDEEMTQKYWWWNLKAMNLKFDIPLTIPPTQSCEDAVQLMHKRKCDQLTIVDDDGAIKGIVTIDKIKQKIADGVDVSSAQASSVMTTKFKKVTANETLGRLFTLFNDCNFVMIVHKQQMCGSGNNIVEKEFVIGVVSRITLMEFITNRRNQYQFSASLQGSGKDIHNSFSNDVYKCIGYGA